MITQFQVVRGVEYFGFVVGFAGIGYGVDRWVVRRVIQSLTHSGRERLGRVLTRALPGAGMACGILIGTELAVTCAGVSDRIGGDIRRGLLILGVIFVTRMGLRATSVVETPLATGSTPSFLRHSLLRFLVNMGIIATGGLVILQLLGLSILPMLTALGVGGIAVALALQDTLSNLFAGIQLILTNQIAKGDYIQLENGIAGRIHDITWRNTVIETVSNTCVMIPNAKVTTSGVTKHPSPIQETRIVIDGMVPIDTDLDQVEAIAKMVGDRVASMPGAAPGMTVRFIGFGDGCVTFTITLPSKTHASQPDIRHAFIKQFLLECRKVGIEISSSKK